MIALVVGIPAGVIAATHRSTPLDYGTMIVALVGISTPVFWAGIVLIYILSFRLGLFPIGGIIGTGIRLDHITDAYVLDSVLTGNWPAFRSSLHHLLLPAFVLSTIPMAIIARMTRSSMLEVLGQDYLRTARAKGLEDRLVVIRHALKNALDPDRDRDRSPVRLAHLRGVPHRNGLRPPGSGAIRRRRDRRARLSGDPGHGPGGRGRLRSDQLLVDVAYAAIDPRIHYA